MKKLFKKLATLAMAAVMMVGVGAAAFAVDAGTYDVNATLCKDAAGTQTSMGNSGIASIEATFDGNGNVDITLVSKPVSYDGETGQLDSFTLYDKMGIDYKATQNAGDDLTFYITGFPADDFAVGKVLTGEFTSYISIMGTRTGYLRIDGLTLKPAA
ncbi:MAG: hypothetical protein Q4C40_06950 [Eubacteriales bacterium]|nr:hypothetical protein [Eubacteriales bacterium]